MLRDFVLSSDRQRQATEWALLKQDIDSMIEVRIPTDAEKIEKYNALSRTLKGSKPTLKV